MNFYEFGVLCELMTSQSPDGFPHRALIWANFLEHRINWCGIYSYFGNNFGNFPRLAIAGHISCIPWHFKLNNLVVGKTRTSTYTNIVALLDQHMESRFVQDCSFFYLLDKVSRLALWVGTSLCPVPMRAELRKLPKLTIINEIPFSRKQNFSKTCNLFQENFTSCIAKKLKALLCSHDFQQMFLLLSSTSFTLIRFFSREKFPCFQEKRLFNKQSDR